MRGNETSTVADYTAIDQQWNGVLPDFFDVRTAWPERASMLGANQGPEFLRFLDGHSTALNP